MRLHLLRLGSIQVDKGRILTPGRDEGVWVTIPVPGYLIETDDGRRIMVDSGSPRMHIGNPDATYGGTTAADELHVLMTEQDDPRARLAQLDLNPADIDILVATHFHFDHAGNHGDFAKSRIVAQRLGYEYNKANYDPYTRDLWDLPHLTYDLIDGDVEIAPGVELLHTGGHAVGHMSVLVRLPNTGPVLLAIDAISTLENLQTGNWRTADDPEQAAASAARLAALADSEGALLLTGHDPDQWAAFGDITTLD
jgi:N-acyl homoserine lactone hydrolase